MATIRDIEKELVGFVEKQIVRLTANATAEIQEATPVDLGWAQASWIPALSSPHRTPAGTRENINPGLSGSATGAVIAGYSFPKPVFISNNVPYITFLNEGSSRQAPKAFVQQSIAKAIKSL